MLLVRPYLSRFYLINKKYLKQFKCVIVSNIVFEYCKEAKKYKIYEPCRNLICFQAKILISFQIICHIEIRYPNIYDYFRTLYKYYDPSHRYHYTFDVSSNELVTFND